MDTPTPKQAIDAPTTLTADEQMKDKRAREMAAKAEHPAPMHPSQQPIPEGQAAAPQSGKALNLAGEEIEQPGKHSDVPAEVPVQAGTALEPALAPPDAEK